MSIQLHILKPTDDITAALAFRAKIMSAAFGITAEQDHDPWDQYAYHVTAVSAGEIVGYYRTITDNPRGFYTESEFDITGLALPRDQILEIGRAAVDPGHRHAGTIPTLWGGILELAAEINRRYVIGTASIKPAETNIIQARDRWRERYQYLSGAHARPLIPVPDDLIMGANPVPKLIQVYERLGARIVSDPSWDPVFRTADVVTVLDVEDANQRWLDKLIS